MVGTFKNEILQNLLKDEFCGLKQKEYAYRTQIKKETNLTELRWEHLIKRDLTIKLIDYLINLMKRTNKKTLMLLEIKKHTKNLQEKLKKKRWVVLMMKECFQMQLQVNRGER